MDKGLQIPSPCVGVCQINASTKYCLGCWRTLREVAHWSRYSNDEKEILTTETSWIYQTKDHKTLQTIKVVSKPKKSLTLRLNVSSVVNMKIGGQEKYK